MLAVVSPAKKLDYESELPTKKSTQPRFLESSAELIDIMQQHNANDLKKLMHISDKIADLNVERFNQWQQPFTASNARPAMFAFKGDVYTGLDAYGFTTSDIATAQKSLRILSGLYGVLRPLDLMQAYRLEMGIKLDTARGKSLYDFWAEHVADSLNKDLKNHDNKVLINLASNEYFRSVKKTSLNAEIITPQFLDWKNGQYKMISFYAKKARGMMSRFMITEKLESPEGLKDFNMASYCYDNKLSTAGAWVFTRKIQD